MKVLLISVLLLLTVGVTNVTADILQWDAPTTNSNGTELIDLAGYIVYTQENCTGSVASQDVGLVTEVKVFLKSIICFRVKAYDYMGNVSDFSERLIYLDGNLQLSK